MGPTEVRAGSSARTEDSESRVPAAGVRSTRWGKILPEIQALRAIAVLLVVIYHLWPTRVPGGFIGVDVFFAISGFLITGHLAKGLVSNGRISVLRFWSHRIWRLIPASLFVLAVCLVFTIVLTPAPVASAALRQIAGSAAYVVNWLLAGDAVDYLARDNAPTLVQHYWSLSVEEQFYLIWPLVLVGLILAFARNSRPERRRRALLTGVSIIVVASLIFSIVSTATYPQRAYFDTLVRVWEFALGGVLALLMANSPAWLARLRAHPMVEQFSLPTWVGLGLIAAAALGLSATTPFPSFWAGIPVVGTLLVIVGGSPTGDRVLAPVLRTRPVQFLGDVSYSLYLWHWPLIVGFAIITGARHGTAMGLVLGVTAVAFAWFTKRFVEDPFRGLGRRLTSVWPAFVLLVVGAALVIAPAAGTTIAREAAAQSAVAEREAAFTDATQCLGAHATLGEADCPTPFVLSPGTDPVLPYVDLSEDWCLTWFDEDWLSCELGDLNATNGTIALVGDSHAAALAVPMGSYFAEHGWKVVTFTRFGCPALASTPIGLARQTAAAEEACAAWTRRVTDELVARTDIDTVVYTSFESAYSVPEAEGALVLEPSSVIETLSTVASSGKDVVLLRDFAVISPGDTFRDVPACVASSTDPAADCNVDIVSAFPPSAQSSALAALGGMVRVVDLSDATCDATRCYSVVGDILAYADYNHISDSFARTLMPYLGPNLVGSPAG